MRTHRALTATGTHVAWKAKRNVPTIGSPVLFGQEIYMVTDKGVASCLDAETGAVRYSERLGGEFSASPLVAGGRVYFFNEDGKTFVVDAGKQFTLLHTNRLDAGCMASPAVLGDAIILRTQTHLYRIENR